jgi:prophage DNA circulation protein
MDYTSGGNTVLAGINTVVRTGLDLGLSGNSSVTSWRDQLQPASYRGIPFGILGGDAHFGRRNAIHEYPFRDSVWVEDLGRSARKINLTGFLVGDDCIAQREKLIKQCEIAVDGELVHPTLGRLNVGLLNPVAISERWDHGRVFELSFNFIESGQRIFPTTKLSTTDNVTTKAVAADAAAAADFATRAGIALRQGAAVVNQAVTTAMTNYRKAQRLANDATNIANLAKSLPGAFGRFSLGDTASAASSTALPGAVATTAVSLQNISAASANLNTAATNLSPSTAGGYGATAQAVTAALLNTSAAPADSLRLLASLADFTPAALADTSQIGLAMNAIQSASADLFRRAAVVALARASALYQPTSQDDAVAVRTQVCSLLDNEITLAADEGDSGSYLALRDVRVAVVNDLDQRSAGLPTLMMVKTALPLPALVLAKRLYRDAVRADELVMRAAPVHPAFMPTSFKALSA